MPDDLLNGWLPRNSDTSLHISGTTDMGPDSDPMSVVDQFLKVKGVQEVRVADALPSCRTASAPTPTPL